MKRWVALLVACGGNNAPTPDTCADAGPACGSACIATFAGNFESSSESTANCAQVSGSNVAFAVASSELDAPLMISIDLGFTDRAELERARESIDGGRRVRVLGGCAERADGQLRDDDRVDRRGFGSRRVARRAVRASAADGRLRLGRYRDGRRAVLGYRRLR
jgi:hypothetical protein